MYIIVIGSLKHDMLQYTYQIKYVGGNIISSDEDNEVSSGTKKRKESTSNNLVIEDIEGNMDEVSDVNMSINKKKFTNGKGKVSKFVRLAESSKCGKKFKELFVNEDNVKVSLYQHLLLFKRGSEFIGKATIEIRYNWLKNG